MATNQKVGGSNPLRRAKKASNAKALLAFFRTSMGFEGGAEMNDSPGDCQNRGVTEPAGETESLSRFADE